MITSYRRTLLALILVFVSLNVLYFADVFGSRGADIYHTVKVKVEAVTEGAIETGAEAWQNVKGWDLWEPLDIDDEGGDATVDVDDAVLKVDGEGEGGSDGTPAVTEEDPVGIPGNGGEIAEAGDGDTDTEVQNAADAVVDVVGGEDTGQGHESSTDANVDELEEIEEEIQEKIDEAMETPVPEVPGGEEEDDEDQNKSGNEDVDENAPMTLPKLCAKTEWTPGLYLACHSRCGENRTSVCGGLNNARNRVQTCLRLAIDMGATLILPSATTRKPSENKGGETKDELRRVNTGSVPTDYFWDVPGLQRNLARGTRKRKGKWTPAVCKELKLREWNDYPEVDITRKISIPNRHYYEAPFYKGTFRERVDNILKNKGISRGDISEKNPVMMIFGDAFIGWEYEKSKEMGAVRAALFGVLNFNQDLLALGDAVLDSPELEDGFIGIHLRGEKDWPSSFGRLGLQVRLYIKEIRKINRNKKESQQVKTLYVSCGNQEAIELFRDRVRTQLGDDYVVVDKLTLLKKRKSLLKQVENLGFDQRAIVEYKTLVEGRYFLGITTSTMSCLIAYARTTEQFSDSGRDFFEDVVYKGSKKRARGMRYWKSPRMKGAAGTKLLVLNSRDIMTMFP